MSGIDELAIAKNAACTQKLLREHEQRRKRKNIRYEEANKLERYMSNARLKRLASISSYINKTWIV